MSEVPDPRTVNLWDIGEETFRDELEKRWSQSSRQLVEGWSRINLRVVHLTPVAPQTVQIGRRLFKLNALPGFIRVSGKLTFVEYVLKSQLKHELLVVRKLLANAMSSLETQYAVH